MRALILSDIHGNLEALQAVLSVAQGLWDEVWNLGDIVGYGGSPNQVVELIRSVARVHVRGNHDRACSGLLSPGAFNPAARAAALWTNAELTPENLNWLREMPTGPVVAVPGSVSCAHGSPLDEDDYLLNVHDACAPLESMLTPITFFGHTHVQGGFARNGSSSHEIRPCFASDRRARNNAANGNGRRRAAAPAESSTLELKPGERVLINPGSVGQPRDRDWRAAFAIFNSEQNAVTFYRVPYDLVASQGRILMANLPERLAARLREGS